MMPYKENSCQVYQNVGKENGKRKNYTADGNKWVVSPCEIFVLFVVKNKG